MDFGRSQDLSRYNHSWVEFFCVSNTAAQPFALCRNLSAKAVYIYKNNNPQNNNNKKKKHKKKNIKILLYIESYFKSYVHNWILWGLIFMG